MKTVIFAFVAMLATFSTKAQALYLSLDNNTGCDIDITVRTIDASCATSVNFGTINILSTNSAVYEDLNTGSPAVQYEVIITVDPSGAAITLPPLTTNGGCGGGPSVNDPSACGSGVTANTTGSSPNWTVTVF